MRSVTRSPPPSPPSPPSSPTSWSQSTTRSSTSVSLQPAAVVNHLKLRRRIDGCLSHSASWCPWRLPSETWLLAWSSLLFQSRGPRSGAGTYFSLTGELSQTYIDTEIEKYRTLEVQKLKNIHPLDRYREAVGGGESGGVEEGEEAGVAIWSHLFKAVVALVRKLASI